ncbi:nuclear transport factor 2 family protein [Mycolicibacterium cosmeticum]|uniref:nuclear transport factor 2 family protein n=1 Tax=Mycolicibacterium cosmeticum TaxID=258533 RepID=UPI0003FC00A4
MNDQDIVNRLRRLEDERDIAKILASYGPAVDAGNADGAARLWAEGGTYDVEGWQMAGRGGVHEMVSSDAHQSLVARGCCHFLGPAAVTVDGDSAVAVCESLVLVRHTDAAGLDPADQYGVWRATANHFTLARIGGRWQITRRSSRVLNGERFAHALLTAGAAGEPTPPVEGSQ